VFLRGDSPQPGVGGEESALAKQLRKHKEESREAERMAQSRGKQAQQPTADESSKRHTGKILELADLAVIVGPSVVQVNVTGPKSTGTGSGFVLDKRGTIVTNYHVIEGATEGTIVFSDRTTAAIKGYLGVWPDKDIALVQVDCSEDKLHPMLLATSAPRQGERVAAFGSPLGLQQSVSEGIVSAVRDSEELRAFGPMEINARLIQTTTPISKGNSGGPLVDMQGLVVGVNTMTFRPIGGENINFAVAMTELHTLVLAKNESVSPLPFRDLSASEVQRILERAMAQVIANEADLAIASCIEAISLDPTNHKAYLYRAMAYEIKGDEENAIADFKEVIRLDPQHVGARQSLGFFYKARKDFNSAIAEFSFAIQFDPTNALNYFERGQCYRKTSDHAKAISDYTNAIRLSPNDPDYHSARGYAHQLNGDDDAAIADYTEAIRLNPKLSHAYVNRGLVYSERKDFDKAIADFTNAIRVDSKNAEAYLKRGLIYSLMIDIESAISDLTDAIRLDPTNANAYGARGWAYGRNDEYDRAIADYTQAIRLDPNNARLYCLRALCYGITRDYDSAIDDFTQAIRLNPKNADAYYGRGMNHDGKGNHDSAIADYTDAILLDPNKTIAYFRRAMAHMSKIDIDNAVADLTHVIRQEPNNATAYHERGLAHQLKGRNAAAEKDFARAKKLGYTAPAAVPQNKKSIAGNNNFSQSPQETTAIETRIDGTFEGWHGDTVVKLINGQIWQQTGFNYEYSYAYNPEVIIYRTGGGYKMKVEGTRQAVEVTRIK
jgi:tetratricopeptide (TPR) repeat protein